MLFFQTLLLGGYGYAHWLSRRGQRGPYLHIALLIFSLLVILLGALAWGSPVLPDSDWRPPDPNAPLLRIILVLLISVGLPYFVLSTTSPLLQSWWDRAFLGRQPYRLYALSNFGSMLALASYPFVFEPLLTLREQSTLWSLAYLSFAALCCFLAYRTTRSVSNTPVPPTHEATVAVDNQPDQQTRGARMFTRLMWIGLAACTSILLLSITSQLSQEVAVIPFLWVLPLSLYLFSFVIAFSGDGWYRRGLYLGALGLATALLAYALYQIESVGILPQIGIYSVFLFLACLVCHTELYRLRPDGRELTSFYFLISLGSALGALFVNLVAPLIFQGYWELQVGVLFCWLLIYLRLSREPASIFRKRWGWVGSVLFLLLFGLLTNTLYVKIRSIQDSALVMNRNFYGVFRVRRISVGDTAREALSLTHGITSHGYQWVDDREQPTSYYTARSGIALAINNLRQRLSRQTTNQGMRMGVIGLGIGTLAAYGQEGDTIRFYEINPDIISLAEGEGEFFTYIKDSQAKVEIIPGDARLSLEAELARGEPQGYHLLAVDAFSGDSIPVHLLTEEAFSIYLEHLAPGGILAMHISNRYLDLTPVVFEASETFNLGRALIYGSSDEEGSYLSKWVLLTEDRSILARGEIAEENLGLAGKEGFRPWTDDYSNLFQVLHFADPLLAIPALALP